MARGPSYNLPFRRRREGKTDYKARRALVKSRLLRIVTRPSLRHMNVQIIEATITGDRVVASANSQELSDFGWKGACGNLPSAYLTGLLCGRRATENHVKTAIADIGLNPPIKGARLFASLKGAIDSGISIPHDPGKLPEDERLKGEHIVKYAEKLASADKELYEKTFSRYIEKKLPPSDLTEQFETTKARIIKLQEVKKAGPKKREVKKAGPKKREVKKAGPKKREAKKAGSKKRRRRKEVEE